MLLLAEISSEWPYDFGYKLGVRLDYKPVDITGDSLPHSWEALVANTLSAIPFSPGHAVKALIT